MHASGKLVVVEGKGGGKGCGEDTLCGDGGVRLLLGQLLLTRGGVGHGTEMRLV